MKVVLTILILLSIAWWFKLHLYFAFTGGLRGLREPLKYMNDYNVLRECKVENKSSTIPPNIFLTSHIPRQDIPDLLGDHAHGFHINFFDDVRARSFMKEHFPQFFDTYSKLKLGAHRADLWRYCILYKYGGVYLDIKVVPRVDLSTFKEYKDKFTWYVVLGGFKTEIYNAILATPPQNPMIWQCILHIARHPIPIWYHQYIHYLLMVVEDNYARPLVSGTFEREDSRVVVWQEICRVGTGADADLYGMKCRVFDEEGTHLFDSRDPAYPWNKKK